MLCSPSRAGPSSSTRAPNVLPAYGLFWATVFNPVSQDSPIALLPDGSCLKPLRPNRLPPQIVSCNEACNRIGCKYSTNLSHILKCCFYTIVYYFACLLLIMRKRGTVRFDIARPGRAIFLFRHIPAVATTLGVHGNLMPL